jgi:hypothetical protein
MLPFVQQTCVDVQPALTHAAHPGELQLPQQSVNVPEHVPPSGAGMPDAQMAAPSLPGRASPPGPVAAS